MNGGNNTFAFKMCHLICNFPRGYTFSIEIIFVSKTSDQQDKSAGNSNSNRCLVLPHIQV